MSIEFERGETVGVVDHVGEAKFIAADEEMVWIRWPDGIRQQVLLVNLRKLPPPFAVVVESRITFDVVIDGVTIYDFVARGNANNVAARINAAFAARMAEEKAGAK